MTSAARPKIALCSPAARPEAALLERHGYRVTASAGAIESACPPSVSVLLAPDPEEALLATRSLSKLAKVPRLGPPPASNEGPFGSYLG